MTNLKVLEATHDTAAASPSLINTTSSSAAGRRPGREKGAESLAFERYLSLSHRSPPLLSYQTSHFTRLLGCHGYGSRPTLRSTRTWRRSLRLK